MIILIYIPYIDNDFQKFIIINLIYKMVYVLIEYK